MGAASKQPKLPSPAGQKVLLNLAAGRDAAFGLSGRSAYGGHVRTMLALRNAGLVSPAPSIDITESGQTMATRLQSN